MIHRCGICTRPTLPSFEFGVRICVAHGPLTWDAFRAHLERDLDAQADMYRSGIDAQANGIAFVAEHRLDRVLREQVTRCVRDGRWVAYVPEEVRRFWALGFPVGIAADGRLQYLRGEQPR